MSEEKRKKEIEVVTGDGEELNISPVYEHIKTDTNRTAPNKKDIVIPKGASDKKKK